MKRLALSIVAVLLSAGLARGDLLCQRWAGKGTPATYGDTLQVTHAGKSTRLVFDLSAIPKDATIHHAALVCFTQGDLQPNDPAQVFVVEKLAGDEATPGGKPLALEPPWYRSFDATEAVRAWVKDPRQNLGLAVTQFERFLPPRTCLDITYEGRPKDLPPQVSDLKAVHHDGQTFIFWKELPDYRPAADEVIWINHFNEKGDKLAEGPGPGAFDMPNHPGITLKALRRLQGLKVRIEPSGIQGIKPLVREREVAPITYRVYRHTERITPKNLHQARRLGEIGPLTGYDGDVYAIHFQGEYINQREEPNSVIPTYCYDKGKHLAPGETMYVHSLRPGDKPVKAYYAVTAVLAGTENASQVADANSLPAPLEEGEYAPPKPVLQWVQTDNYHDDVPEYWFRYWSAPPYYHLPFRSFRVALSAPAKLKPLSAAGTQPASPPVPMIVGTISDSFNVRGSLNLPSREAITLLPEKHTAWMPDVFYNEGRGTLRGMNECKVDYFTERYMDFMIKWVWGLYNIDKSRISGSMLYFGMRHPEIFATMSFGAYTADYDRRWAPGSGSMPGLLGPKGIKTVDGDDAWEMFSVSGYVNRYVQRDIPFLICISAVGKDSGHTSEFGWQDDPRGWAGLLKARQTFVAAWSLGPPGELMGAFAKMRWDVTIPAFTGCSLDNNPGNGDPPDGDYYGCINGWLLWGDKEYKDDPAIQPPTDEKERWEMTVWVISSCPEDRCTVDITPRHCKLFKPAPGDKFKWTNRSAKDGKVIATGDAAADQYGLVTIPTVAVSKAKNRIVIEKR